MSVLCTLVRKDTSTGEIISILNYNAIYPNVDPSEPVVGLDPDLEYYAHYYPYDIPDYDPRIFILNITQGPGSGINEYHPSYLNLKQWRFEYTTIKRTVDEQKIQVSNAEENANNLVFPHTKQLKYLALGIAVLNRKIDGITLTTKEETLLQRIHDKALKIWINDQNTIDKNALIDLDQEPNLDDGWENIDPEDE